jgi:hypothetical protein
VPLALALLISFSATLDPITIDKKPPTTQRVIVENPATMPEHRNEDAWCRFFFNCSVHLKYQIVDQQKRDGRVYVTAKVTQVSITLTLDDTILLPKHSTEKLKAHEEGHRKINERVYAESAEAAARAAAREVMSKTWDGSGADEDAAGKDATDEAVKELCDQYLNATAEKALRIGRVYDELTDHGKRVRPTEDEAIQKAFESKLSPNQ